MWRRQMIRPRIESAPQSTRKNPDRQTESNYEKQKYAGTPCASACERDRHFECRRTNCQTAAACPSTTFTVNACARNHRAGDTGKPCAARTNCATGADRCAGTNCTARTGCSAGADGSARTNGSTGTAGSAGAAARTKFSFLPRTRFHEHRAGCSAASACVLELRAGDANQFNRCPRPLNRCSRSFDSCPRSAARFD